MADMPFFPGGSGGGQGTSNYDALTNKPVINLSGDPVVITELATGVYNIDGSWAMTEDSEPVNSLKDDLFYVRNDSGNYKLTWITAGGIHTYGVPEGGTAEDVREDVVPTTEEVVNSLVGDF